MGKEKLNHSGTHTDSMRISDKQLFQFIWLFEQKTGRKLDKSEAVARAGILLRTMSILYKPVPPRDYYSALAQKMFLKTKKV